MTMGEKFKTIFVNIVSYAIVTAMLAFVFAAIAFITLGIIVGIKTMLGF